MKVLSHRQSMIYCRRFIVSLFPGVLPWVFYVSLDLQSFQRHRFYRFFLCCKVLREVIFYCQNEPYNGPFIEIDQQSSLNYPQSEKYRRRKVKIPPGSIKKIGKTKKLSNSDPDHGLDVSSSFNFFYVEHFGKNCVVSKCE